MDAARDWTRPTAIWPGGSPVATAEAESPPYSPATRAGDWVFVSGQLASDDVEDIAPSARVDGRLPYHADALERQARYIVDRLETVLGEAGASLDDVVQMNQWTVVPPAAEACGTPWRDVSLGRLVGVREERFGVGRPGSCIVGVEELLVRNTLLEIDATAVIGSPGRPVEAVETGGPRGAVLPYSRGTRAGDWTFLTCGVPVAPPGPEKAMPPWYAAPVRTQTDAVLTNLAAAAEAAGSSLADAVQATVYLASPRDYLDFEDVWRSWFAADPPARSVVPGVVLPWPGARVAASMVCLAPGSALERRAVETTEAPGPLGHEPQAVRAGQLVFLSGQMAADESSVAPGAACDPRFPYYGAPATQQMSCIMRNVAAICEAAGTDVMNICRRRAFHVDLADSVYSIQEWARHFPGDKPASTTFRIGGPLLVPGC